MQTPPAPCFSPFLPVLKFLHLSVKPLSPNAFVRFFRLLKFLPIAPLSKMHHNSLSNQNNRIQEKRDGCAADS